MLTAFGGLGLKDLDRATGEGTPAQTGEDQRNTRPIGDEGFSRKSNEAMWLPALR